MYRLSERPLTWLFVIATLCADATIPLANPMVTGGVQILYTALILGQLCLGAAWLVCGSVHRLLRGAAFILLPAGLATLIAFLDLQNYTIKAWGRIFGSLILVAVPAAGGAGLGRLASRSMFASGGSQTKLQYPISELLGWMIVVAVASWALSAATFGHLVSQIELLMFVLSSSATAGFAVALAARQPGRGARVAVAVAIAFLIGYAVYGGIEDRSFYKGTNLAFGYLALAIVVRRLDKDLLTRRKTDAPEGDASSSPEP